MPEKNLESQLRDAGVLVDRGQYQDAVALYESIANSHAECIEAWLMLGSLYGEAGETEKAINSLVQATKLDPENVSVQEILGQVYCSKGDLQQALGCFDKAVFAHPDDADLHCLVAEVYRAQGNQEAAIDAFERARNCENATDQINAMLGYLYLQKEDYPNAEEYYRQYLLNDKDDVAAVTGWCAAMPGVEKRSAESEQLLESYLKSKTSETEIIVQLAGMCSRLGRHGDAEDLVERVLKENPGDDRCLLAKAEILERQGDLPGAFEILKPFLESQPVNVHAVLIFAKFSHVVGLKNECLQLLQTVLADEELPHDTRGQVLMAVDWVNSDGERKHAD